MPTTLTLPTLSNATTRQRELSAPPHAPLHIPALDGIRGLAVLLVLFCHATVIRPGGMVGQLFLSSARISWSGVDLFFVLSGFLITGILFDAKGERHFFRNFYARRTVRIFPLYYAFLVFALVLIPAVPFLAQNFGTAPKPSLFYWLYLSNFSQALHGTSHIVHVSWSLAIEEQFYLAWPLVVFLFTRATLRRICATMFFGCLALRAALLVSGIGGTEAWAIANGFTFLRLDGLAAGAWIALTIRTGDRAFMSNAIKILANRARLIGTIAAIGIVLVVGGSYLAGSRVGIAQSKAYVVIGYTLFALMYASVLLFAVDAPKGSLLNRMFAGRFLRAFGKYSYAIYLLHEPVNTLFRNYVFDPQKDGRSNAVLLAGQFVFYVATFTISYGLALVSWHAMEKHFLKLKDKFQSHPQPPREQPAPPPRILRPAA